MKKAFLKIFVLVIVSLMTSSCIWVNEPCRYRYAGYTVCYTYPCYYTYCYTRNCGFVRYGYVVYIDYAWPNQISTGYSTMAIVEMVDSPGRYGRIDITSDPTSLNVGDYVYF